MASAGSLIFELAADTSTLKSDMTKAAQVVSSSLESIATSSAATALMSGARFAEQFARGFAENIGQAIKTADAFGDLAKQAGTSTEAISTLVYAGRLSNVTMEEMEEGIRGLSRALVDVRNPGSQAAKAFDAIGLSAQSLKNQDPVTAFKNIATAMSQFKDGADKTAVAMQIFSGRAGMEFVNFLDQGKTGIDDLTEEAKRMGFEVSGSTSDAMKALDRDLDRMKANSAALYLQFAIALEPAIKEVTRLMGLMKTSSGDLNDSLGILATTAKGVIATVIGIAGTVGSLAAVTEGFVGLLKSMKKDGGMEEGLAAMNAGWTKGQAVMDSTVKSMDTIMHKLTDQEKAQKAQAEAAKAAADAQDNLNKKTLVFNPGTEKTAKAKKTIDEYTKMVDDLNKKIGAIGADSNPMSELLGDPKFQKLTQDQQESIKALMNDYLDLKAATDQEKVAQTDLDKQRQQSAELNGAALKSLQDQADSQLDAIDPLRVYEREMANYNAMLQYTIVNQTQYNQLVKAAGKTFDDAYKGVTPMTEQTKALTAAIDGFGKTSADAFVSFADGADSLGDSFRKLVASMLEEMAKVIAYQYVFKSMFDSISKFQWSDVANLFASTASVASPGVQSVSPVALASSASVLGRSAGVGATGGSTGTSGSGSPTGTPTVQVNVHMHSDGSSKKDTEDTTADNRQSAALGKRIAAAVRQVIATEKRTGGLLAPTPTR